MGATVGSQFTIESRQKLAKGRDPMKNWLFFIDFGDGLKDMLTDDVTSRYIDGIDDIAEELLVRAESVQIPQVGVGEITSNFAGLSQVFAGKLEMPHNVSIKMKEFEDQVSQRLLHAWRAKAANVETGLSQAVGKRADAGDGYALKSIDIIVYAGNGAELAYRYRLYNVWCKKLDGISLDYNGSNPVEVTAELEFDYILPIDNESDNGKPGIANGVATEFGPDESGLVTSK
jgi:hypothetical protein